MLFQICRSLGFDVRHVNDCEDHVWVEVWSERESRWVHADPCEGAYDKPLLYEAGWGKKLSFVVASSRDETADVTWRYTSDHAAVRARRDAQVPRGWVVGATRVRTEEAQEGRAVEERKRLTRRRLLELVELMAPRDASSVSEEERRGRLSGSAAWRAARGEDGGGAAEEKSEPTVWTLLEAEKESRVFHLEYDVISDRYVRPSPGDESGDSGKKGWRSGVKEAGDVFRKREPDWKQCYLARRGTVDFNHKQVLNRRL